MRACSSSDVVPTGLHLQATPFVFERLEMKLNSGRNRLL